MLRHVGVKQTDDNHQTAQNRDLKQNNPMMILGFIWAAFAPVILVVLVVALAWRLNRVGVRGAVVWAMCVVIIPVALLWFLDREEFLNVCTGEGKPFIIRKAKADGVFLNSSTANSFGMRYLHEEGFSWVEAPSIYHRGSWVRYARSGPASNGTVNDRAANITTTEIAEITARYEVREESSEPFDHTHLSQTVIVDRTNQEIMAKAGTAHFSGGRAKWVLGAWGSLSCPSPMSHPDDFNDYYHLAKKTLR